MEAGYVTADEATDIAALIRTIKNAEADENGVSVSMGDIPIHDSNGESLGVITVEDGERVWKP